MKFTMRLTQANNGGSAPATPGFNAVAPEWLFKGAAGAAPAIPAAESTLGSHPCVALSSAQVLPEWINRNTPSTENQRTATTPLTLCLTPGVHFTRRLKPSLPFPGFFHYFKGPIQGRRDRFRSRDRISHFS